MLKLLKAILKLLANTIRIHPFAFITSCLFAYATFVIIWAILPMTNGLIFCFSYSFALFLAYHLGAIIPAVMLKQIFENPDKPLYSAIRQVELKTLLNPTHTVISVLTFFIVGYIAYVTMSLEDTIEFSKFFDRDKPIRAYLFLSFMTSITTPVFTMFFSRLFLIGIGESTAGNVYFSENGYRYLKHFMYPTLVLSVPFAFVSNLLGTLITKMTTPFFCIVGISLAITSTYAYSIGAKPQPTKKKSKETKAITTLHQH